MRDDGKKVVKDIQVFGLDKWKDRWGFYLSQRKWEVGIIQGRREFKFRWVNLGFYFCGYGGFIVIYF